ncbi:MAG: hypothetical protein ACPGUD_04970 [Parashewanella sp.]
MSSIITSILFSYFSLLLFATSSARYRASLWGQWFKEQEQNDVKPWQLISLRVMAYVTSALGIYFLCQVYGPTLGISNWFCLAAILAVGVVVSLSYMLSSLLFFMFFMFCVFSFTKSDVVSQKILNLFLQIEKYMELLCVVYLTKPR